MGSLGFVAAARTVWCVTRDTADPERRLLLPVKNNLAESEGTGIGWRIIDTAVAWDEMPVIGNAQDHFEEAEGDKRSGPRQRAAQFMRDFLKDGERRSTEVKEAAEQAGISLTTLDKAKKDANVETKRKGFGEGSYSVWGLAV